jgi:hypothetical protein
VIASPTPGEASFAIDVAALAPNAACLSAFALHEHTTHLGSGCVVWTDAPDTLRLDVADAHGDVHFAMPLPASPLLLGLAFTTQTIVLDPTRGVLGPLTFTDALRITVGD